MVSAIRCCSCSNDVSLSSNLGAGIALRRWTDEGTKFSGDDYLLSFALPNFYFHVSMVHAILRNNGVTIGKLDYLGPYD